MAFIRYYATQDHEDEDADPEEDASTAGGGEAHGAGPGSGLEPGSNTARGEARVRLQGWDVRHLQVRDRPACAVQRGARGNAQQCNRRRIPDITVLVVARRRP